MATVIENAVTIRFSKLVKGSGDGETVEVTADQLQVIEAALDEVLELPAGVIVEVEANES